MTITKLVISGSIASLALPVAALVHVRTVLCDSVGAAWLLLQVDTLHWTLWTGGGELQAVHPAVSLGFGTFLCFQSCPGTFQCKLICWPGREL